MEIRSIDGFLDYLLRIRERTQRVVDLVPDDRLDWRPDPGAFSFADLERPSTTPAGAELRVWKWLRALVEHEVHHRGQLHLMLRMVSVETPPLYGLTSERVFAHSESLAAPPDTRSHESDSTDPEVS